MKKFMSILLLCVTMVVLSACDATPSGPGAAAVECYEALKDGNTDKYLDMIYYGEKAESDPQELAKSKEALGAIIKEKIKTEQMAELKKLKTIEVANETIAEDGNSAKVQLKFVSDNGESKTEEVKMKKTPKGEWKMDMDK